ncbi:hypothetical protein WN982_40050 [Paraburkholderia sp. IMGN_8]|uniref:hypothetical protein n=1 Tax=Paraburkholderia sp. IMGN_8 TaxID=3136564 RepID=UPI003100EB16
MSVYTVLHGEEVFLERWSIRESDRGTRHFVGFDIRRGDGRVSTPINEFDPATRTGKTENGSRYQLIGRAGHDSDAEYVWRIAIRAWGIGSWTDVTAELVPNWRQGLLLASGDGDEDAESGEPEDGMI